jgi:hypothetical protein
MSSPNSVCGDGLFKGVLFSTLGAVKLSLFLAIGASFIALLEGKGVDEAAAMLVIFALAYSLITGLIAFCVALIVGVPVVSLLAYFQLADRFIAGFIAAFLMFLVFVINGGFNLGALVFIVYAFYCGLSFMKGYQRGVS